MTSGVLSLTFSWKTWTLFGQVDGRVALDLQLISDKIWIGDYAFL